MRTRSKKLDAPPPASSAVYDGARLMGEIKPRKGLFAATLAGGAKLGVHATARAAMLEICRADRAARARSCGPRGE